MKTTRNIKRNWKYATDPEYRRGVNDRAWKYTVASIHRRRVDNLVGVSTHIMNSVADSWASPTIHDIQDELSYLR